MDHTRLPAKQLHGVVGAPALRLVPEALKLVGANTEYLAGRASSARDLTAGKTGTTGAPT